MQRFSIFLTPCEKKCLQVVKELPLTNIVLATPMSKIVTAETIDFIKKIAFFIRIQNFSIMASKTFVNNTGHEIVLTLFVRKGDRVNLVNSEKTAPFVLKKGERQRIPYGNDTDVDLNAIRFSLTDEFARLVSEQEVLKKGCWWDKMLNGHNVITIHGLDRDKISGRNVGIN